MKKKGSKRGSWWIMLDSDMPLRKKKSAKQLALEEYHYFMATHRDNCKVYGK